MKHFRSDIHKSEHGSLLVLVMWILILLSIFCFSIGFSVRQRLLTVERLESRSKLRDIAQAGVIKAIYLLESKKEEEPFYDSLNDDWSKNETAFNRVEIGGGVFRVGYEIVNPGKKKSVTFNPGLIDEERKINLNSTNSLTTFSRLFQFVAGLDEEKANAVAAAVVDWKDEDEFLTDQGAESDYYQSLAVPHKSKNKSFDTLEELLYVQGVTSEIYEAIKPYVTLYSSGKININTAHELVFRVIGVSDFLISKIITYRNGNDRIAGTDDDRVFKSLSEIVAILQQYTELNESETSEAQMLVDTGVLSVSSQYFSIQSTGELAHRKGVLTIECIVSRYHGVVHWFEQYSVN